MVGKPSRPYFESALAALEARADEATMVGDDVESDVGGAKRLGMRGVLVRTGKFREEALAAADPQPDAVLDSIVELPAWLASRPDASISPARSTAAAGRVDEGGVPPH